MTQKNADLYYAEDVLNSAPSPWIGINEKQEIIILNKKLELLFGHASEKIIAPSIKNYFQMACKSIKNFNNDLIAIKSKIGDGSEFIVTFNKS